MSPRRIVATCAAMALVVGIGSWYAVSAFPLQATTSSTSEANAPGPLELAAHRVTPEKPDSAPSALRGTGPARLAVCATAPWSR